MKPSGHADVELGLNLAQFAIEHVEFLKEVNNYPVLYGGPVLQRAIWRYTELWLPLAAEHPLEDLCAPLDIEWVWHCHMLAPLLYETDCKKHFKTVPGHRVANKTLRECSLTISEQYWKEKYTEEPFQVDLNGDDLEEGQFDRSRTFDLVYDLTAAAGRQKVFYYQVSLPHYKDKTFLQNSVVRYQKFLYLKYRSPDMFLVPCYDIDVIWHTHMNFPNNYKNLTGTLLGKVLHHDDSVNDRSEGSKLSMSERNTRGLWRAMYNEHFSSFGGMYRGEPPFGKLEIVTADVKMALFSKDVVIKFDKIELYGTGAENLGKHKICVTEKDYTIMRDHRGVQEKIDLSEEVIILKGPPSLWEGWEDIGQIKKTLGCLTGDNLYIQIMRMNGFLCCTGGASLEGEGCLNINKVSSVLTHTNKSVTDKLTLEIDSDLKVDVEFTASLVSLGSCELWLLPGTFEDCVMPELSEQLWGPVPLPKLPPGVENKCSVASHRLQDYKRQIHFTCRLVHSLPLMMSAVQVFHHDKMVVVAHVIGADQLPKPEHLHDKTKCLVLDPRKGERAILIKNNFGDWGVLIGRWEGFRHGVPPKKGQGGQLGNPGYLAVSFYNMSIKAWEHVSMEETYVKEQFRFTLLDADIDLKNGKICVYSHRHQRPNNEIAEHLALAFSVSLLHVLVQPRPSKWEPGDSLEPQTDRRGVRAVKSVQSSKMALVLAAGLMIATPSNHHIRSRFARHPGVWNVRSDAGDEDERNGNDDEAKTPVAENQDGQKGVEEIGNLITDDHDRADAEHDETIDDNSHNTNTESGNDQYDDFNADIYTDDFDAFYRDFGDTYFGDANTDTGAGFGDRAGSDGGGFSNSWWDDGDAGGCGGCGGGFGTGGGVGGDSGGGGGGFGGAFDSGGFSGGAFDSGNGAGDSGGGGGWGDSGGGDSGWGGGDSGWGGGDGGFGGGDGGAGDGGGGGCGGGCGG